MILELEYCGLVKVISGGQCGVDRAGLESAKKHRLETGGTAPKGWRTWYGPAPELGTEFGLVEHWSEDYTHRTKQNVQDSDATLILATNFQSAGTALTANTCRLYGKPVLCIDLTIPWEFDSQIACAEKWLKKNSISTLNIAGNRDTGTGATPTINFDRAFEYLDRLFVHLDSKSLLVVPTDKY